MLFGEAGLGRVPLGGTLSDTGLLIGVEIPIGATAQIGTAVTENGEVVAVLGAPITATASLGSLSYQLTANIDGVSAAAALAGPVAQVITTPTSLAATASTGAPVWGILVSSSTVSANAITHAPEVRITLTPTGISAEAELGVPDWVAIAAPYSVRAYASLLPVWLPAEAIESIVLAINASTLAVTEYSVTAIDVLEHNGEMWFVAAGELSKFTTGTVDASIETGMLELGIDDKKYVAGVKARLSGDSTTGVTFTIELDGRELEFGPYDLPARSGSASFVRQFKLAGGVKADSVSLKFETVAGTAWSLDGLALLADSL